MPSETPTLTSQSAGTSNATTVTEGTYSGSTNPIANTTTLPNESHDAETTSTQQTADGEQPEQPEQDEFELEEDVFDPASIVRDMVADDSAGRHLLAMQRYSLEKELLIGEVVPTSAGLSWTVCCDIKKSEVVSDPELELPVGVKNFDFNNKTDSLFGVQAEGIQGLI